MLVATPAVTAQVGSYCFTDDFGFVWDIEPDGPTDILFGQSLNVYGGDAPIIGGRGRSSQTIRHHSVTTLNPALADDPGCTDGSLTDWFITTGR